MASLALVFTYPFMKRVTWWPQAFLGLTFNWGVLMGWSAVTGQLAVPALLLYAGAIAWTVGYDTIYAHQDKEDDAFVGVHSTARLFGSQSGRWIAVFYILALLGFAAAGAAAGLGWPYWAALAGVSLQLLWQVRALNTDDPADCLRRFRQTAGADGPCWRASSPGASSRRNLSYRARRSIRKRVCASSTVAQARRAHSAFASS